MEKTNLDEEEQDHLENEDSGSDLEANDEKILVDGNEGHDGEDTPVNVQTKESNHGHHHSLDLDDQNKYSNDNKLFIIGSN